MKKVIFVSLVILLTTVLFGCTNNKEEDMPNNGSSNTPTDRYGARVLLMKASENLNTVKASELVLNIEVFVTDNDINTIYNTQMEKKIENPNEQDITKIRGMVKVSTLFEDDRNEITYYLYDGNMCVVTQSESTCGTIEKMEIFTQKKVSDLFNLELSILPSDLDMLGVDEMEVIENSGNYGLRTIIHEEDVARTIIGKVNGFSDTVSMAMEAPNFDDLTLDITIDKDFNFRSTKIVSFTNADINDANVQYEVVCVITRSSLGKNAHIKFPDFSTFEEYK